MQSKISDIKDRITKARVEQRYIKSALTKVEKSLTKARRTRSDNRKSVVVIEFIIEKNYDVVIEMFENTVSTGFQELFNDDYAFKMVLDRSGMSTTCAFHVRTDKCKQLQDLKMTQGKSVQEIISVLMRLVICKLDDQIMNVVLLDEPLGGLRVHRKEKASAFLNKICKDFGFQVLLVTQSPEMVDHADNGINLEKQSKVKW